MAEYIELIDKYLVTRGESETPSYRWVDNTGEVIRCRDCTNWNTDDSSGWSRLGNYRCSCAEWSTEVTTYYTAPDEFCSRGERKGGDAE